MSVPSKTKLVEKLCNKEYRDAYSEESIKTSLPFQIRALREQEDRNWSQTVLGVKSGMKQNAVSRLESAEYGNLSINTLLRLASAFDVALLVKFVPYSRLVTEFEDLSPKSLEVKEFNKDLQSLSAWAMTSKKRPRRVNRSEDSEQQSLFVDTAAIKSVRGVGAQNSEERQPASNQAANSYGALALITTETKAA
jgi:transcriptional regulator with XRE-family HTH domain